jgi:PAS domain S-box-containing protein
VTFTARGPSLAGAKGGGIAYARSVNLGLRDGSLAAYAAAAAMMLAALWGRACTATFVPDFPPLMLPFLAVLAAGRLCGASAGLLAIALGAGAAEFVWPQGFRPAMILPGMDAPRDAGFILVCGLILWTTTSLRRAAIEAESTRMMLDAALVAGDVGAWEVDLATLMVRAPRGVHDLHGLRHGEAPRPLEACKLETWLSRMMAEDATRIRDLIAGAARSGGNLEAQYRLPRHDGTIRHIILRGRVVGPQGGRRVVGALIDITDKARAEAAARAHMEALHESDAKFRALAEAIPGMLFLSDLAGRNTYTNRYFSEFTGLSFQDLLGDGWTRVVHPDDLSSAAARWNDMVLARGPLYEIEYRLRAGDGSYHWFLCRGEPVRDAGGEITAWCGVALEIEDRKTAEAALADSAERLRLVIAAGGVGTFEVELDSRVRHWDERMAAIFGLAPQAADIPAARVEDFCHPEDWPRVAAQFEQAVLTGRLGESEFRIITSGGEVRWVVSSGVILRQGDGQPGGERRRLIGAVRDITGQRLREDALRKALAAREVVVREADHRIKNSLQLIVSMLSMQRRRLTDQDASDALGVALARVEAVAQMHLGLQHSEDLKTLDLSIALRGLCAGLGHLNPAVALQCTVPPSLMMDAERAIPLSLIVSELLTNTLRHAYPSGGGVVAVVAALSGETLEVTVSDAGAGYEPGDESGLGSRLIRSMAGQIGADVTTHAAPGAGVTSVISLTL